MSIDGIGSRSDQATLQLKQNGNRGKSDVAHELRETFSKAVKIGNERAEESGSTKGVVHLLQEGHFQGVADVRLHLNFYDQLQQGLSQQSGEVLKTWSLGLMTELDVKVQALSEEFQMGDQVGDLKNSFRENAEGLVGTLGKGAESSAVIGGLREAFSGFLSSLQTIGTASASPAEADSSVTGVTGDPVPESVAEAAGMNESTVSPDPDAFSVALQNLQEWFDEELNALEDTVNDMQVLPDPGEPHGNGVAYDRFLEIYRGLETEADSGRTHGKV